MKKLSLLVALALLITVGGVYATWSYAGTNDIADAYAEMTVTIADTVLTGANGTYAVTSNLVLTVDQVTEDHEAGLVFASNNGAPIVLTVTFTPAENAPQNIKNAGVPSWLYFGTTNTMQYKMDPAGNYSAEGTLTDIFEFTNSSINRKEIEWIPGGGVFTYTMDEAALRAQINLNETFVLDTKTEHDQFGAALSGNIVAHVTDGNTTP